MQVNYKTDLEDVVAFNIYHLRTLPKTLSKQRRNKVVISFIYAMVGVLCFIYSPSHWVGPVLFVTLSVLWFTFYDRAWGERVRKQVYKAYAKNRSGGLEQENLLEVLKEGLHVKNHQNEGIIPWPVIQKVAYLDDFIYVYLSDEEAIIIPRKKLGDDSLFKRLREGLRYFCLR